MDPSYKLDDFFDACRIGVKAVFVKYDAEQSAKSDFNLKSKNDLLLFIASDGVSEFQLDNTTDWKLNPDKEKPIMVDSYNFFTKSIYGYLAFMFQPKMNKWTLKSFKKNDRPDPRKKFKNNLLEEHLKRAIDNLEEKKK